jgi:DDE superfamily endonuclease
MAEHGVGTYMALQKKYIRQTSVDKRGIWAFERRYWNLNDFKRYRYTDESHIACGLQRQARIHRRRGTKARNASTKVQFRLKRRNQVWHVYGVIGRDYKSPLHFYTGSGGGGRLTQADYLTIIEEVIAPNWDKDWILVEDNDNAHGTRGKADNKVKQAKRRLGICWEANPPESPDLNPVETIWRIIKQRLKNRGVIDDPTVLRRAIEVEWDKITLKEINKAISTMPDRVAAVRERDGVPIPF